MGRLGSATQKFSLSTVVLRSRKIGKMSSGLLPNFADSMDKCSVFYCYAGAAQGKIRHMLTWNICGVA